MGNLTINLVWGNKPVTLMYNYFNTEIDYTKKNNSTTLITLATISHGKIYDYTVYILK